ncbi:hypothetical protein EWI61_13320 [Methylolobus aquaticus]|nr:hypothetical protein EWI61_13320 [Methylolobus aquaticus]
MDVKKAIGLTPADLNPDESRLRRRHFLNINLTLAAAGQPICQQVNTGDFISVAEDLVHCYRAQSRLVPDYLCPADQRIQTFLDAYLADLRLANPLRLPSNTLILHRFGIARELSLPPDGDRFESDIIKSYRVRQGVLHNTLRDRRTTKGSFHIAEGGLPIPSDKRAVPKLAFARLLQAALNPPRDLLGLPFTCREEEPAEIFVSLLLRPTVSPAVPGVLPEKSMEIRFFAPGGMVSNLDFVESIFGNAGNPHLPENDAGLDIDHWTGHTGCIILAPHLLGMTKKELGLPRYSQATERQRADRMCWQDESELYNDGEPYKITARDASGTIVTLITDNYFGYCKKEVKTQISFSANLFGLAEEEHAGGALTFASHNHGEEFGADPRIRLTDHNFADVKARFGDIMDIQPEGYGIDKRFPQLCYLPEDMQVDLNNQRISWRLGDSTQRIPLRPGQVYMHPTGYKIEMRKHPSAPSWRLVGTDAEGLLCHKPCTVSGGGKSEISKSIDNTILFGPVFVADLEQDLDFVESLCNRDYSDRYRPGMGPDYSKRRCTPLLSPKRSLGSVIKLLNPSPSTFTDDYNAWLETIPTRIKSIVFMIKRFYRPEWGTDWRRHFATDIVNGSPGHELKMDDRALVASYLRIGFEQNGSWRVFKLRQDYIAAEKLQMEDDITASVVIPTHQLRNRPPAIVNPSVKLTHNCEYRLFQRPDDAVHRGLDLQAERDLTQSGNFISNFEPLGTREVQSLVDDVIGFNQYSPPMQEFLQAAVKSGEGFAVSSAHPRIVDGKPSKNPRYLQLRQDLEDEFKPYLAEMGARLSRRIPLHEPVMWPVGAVLAGRRNNPPDWKSGIRPLCVYSPIHYQELPELFMDFICSLTGKSPSTTGAGSEGALTKGPFNALRATADLNAALVSYILTGYGGFSTAAGHVGPHFRVDHDISLLAPEIWCRLSPQAQDPDYLIREGYLEPVLDFEHEGKTVLASRLGYRITSHFVHHHFGKLFDTPSLVLTEEILKPEKQDLACFVDGIANIVETQRRVAQEYLDDGSIDEACPPLRALLYIMATGSYEGKGAHHPAIRSMFTRENLLGSAWYRERLRTKQERDIELWRKHVLYLESFLDQHHHTPYAEKLRIIERLERARRTLAEVSDAAYPDRLVGTLGADPMTPRAAGRKTSARRSRDATAEA